VLRTVVAIGCALSIQVFSPRAFAEDSVAACVKAAEDAQTQRSAHQLRAARQQFLVCAQASCPLVVRQDCAGWLSEVDKLMPSIVVQARDTRGVELVDVRVIADGDVIAERLDGLAISVDPGVHLFQFESPGAPPLQQRILIREGEKGRALGVTLAAMTPPPEEARPRTRNPPPLTYVFGGLGLGGLAGFAYFGLTGRADADELGQSPCGKAKTCREDELAPIRQKLLVADISLGIGVLSLGAAAYFYFTDRAPPGRTRGSVYTDLELGPSGGRFTLVTPF
jgi:hypothetical protein